jgi:predicted DNA-binding transcriptional regulator AlpA
VIPKGIAGHEPTASARATGARRLKAAKRVTGRDDGQLSLDFEGGPPVAPMLLTERQVCEMLNIGRTTLRAIPELRPIHIGRCVRYLLSDVLEYVAGSRDP